MRALTLLKTIIKICIVCRSDLNYSIKQFLVLSCIISTRIVSMLSSFKRKDKSRFEFINLSHPIDYTMIIFGIYIRCKQIDFFPAGGLATVPRSVLKCVSFWHSNSPYFKKSICMIIQCLIVILKVQLQNNSLSSVCTFGL